MGKRKRHSRESSDENNSRKSRGNSHDSRPKLSRKPSPSRESRETEMTKSRYSRSRSSSEEPYRKRRSSSSDWVREIESLKKRICRYEKSRPSKKCRSPTPSLAHSRASSSPKTPPYPLDIINVEDQNVSLQAGQSPDALILTESNLEEELLEALGESKLANSLSYNLHPILQSR